MPFATGGILGPADRDAQRQHCEEFTQWPLLTEGSWGASCKSRRHALQPYGYFYFDPDLLTSNNFGITIPIVAQMDII